MTCRLIFVIICLMLISVFENNPKVLVQGQVEIPHDIEDLKRTKNNTLVRLRCSKGILKRCKDVNEVSSMKDLEKRCCGNKKPRRRKDKGGQALYDDHGYNTIPEVVYKPRLKVCRFERCLTFTHGRKAFSARENAIVSSAKFVEVIEGKWELCGEFEYIVSCLSLDEGDFMNLLEGEWLRITTFRKVGQNYDPKPYPDVPTLPPPATESSDKHKIRELLDQIESMSEEVEYLSKKIESMEETLVASTKLFLNERYSSNKKRRKVLKILKMPDNT